MRIYGPSPERQRTRVKDYKVVQYAADTSIVIHPVLFVLQTTCLMHMRIAMLPLYLTTRACSTRSIENEQERDDMIYPASYHHYAPIQVNFGARIHQP